MAYALLIAGLSLLGFSVFVFRKSIGEFSKTSFFLILLCVMLFFLAFLLSFLKGG